MAGILAAGLTACSLDNDETPGLTPSDSEAIVATIEADNANEKEADVINEFVNIGFEDEGQKSVPLRFRRFPDDATLTWTNDANMDGTMNDYRLEIDFGTQGVECYDGVFRRGKIFSEATGFYRSEGTRITTTTQNYATNRDTAVAEWVEHDFNRSVQNQGANIDGNLEYSIVESNTSTEPDGQVTNWSSSRVREWDYGTDGNAFTNDDFYYITGTAITERTGVRTIDRAILEPLAFKFNCGVVWSGVLQYRDRNSGNVITTDYGVGCTAAKTIRITINGIEYAIVL